jgi:hypothetical protein
LDFPDVHQAIEYLNENYDAINYQISQEQSKQVEESRKPALEPQKSDGTSYGPLSAIELQQKAGRLVEQFGTLFMNYIM